MKLRLVALICSSIFWSQRAFSGTVGLAPSNNDLAACEARTATARGRSALFYNPAGLARDYWQLDIIRYHTAVSDNAKDLVRDSQNSEKGGNENLKNIFDIIRQGDPYHLDIGASFPSVVVPYFGASSFGAAQGDFTKSTNSDGVTNYDLNASVRAGIIAGFAVRVGKLAIGYSQYVNVQSDVEVEMSEEEITDLKVKLDSGELTDETIPYRDYTQIKYGQGMGRNFGVLYRPWIESPTGLGISVLNAGGTEMDKSGIITNEKFAKKEAEVNNVVEEHGIELGFPDELKEMINVGLSFGTGGGSSDIFTALLALDALDVGRPTATAKFAASFDGEVVLPPEVAKTVKFVVENKKSNYKYHIGLRGGELTWGVLADSHYSRAVGINIHGGVNDVSFVNLRIQNFWRQYFDESKLTVTGYAFELGISLVY